MLQLVLFQRAEEIGFTGFLQHHWQDRYHPMKLALYVALLWAVWLCREANSDEPKQQPLPDLVDRVSDRGPNPRTSRRPPTGRLRGRIQRVASRYCDVRRQGVS